MCHRRAVRALDRACATGLRARAPSAEPLLAFLCDAVVPHPWYRTICISGAESPARTPATAGRARSGRGRGRGPAAIPGSARPPPGPRRARQDPAPAHPARRGRLLALGARGGIRPQRTRLGASGAWRDRPVATRLGASGHWRCLARPAMAQPQPRQARVMPRPQRARPGAGAAPTREYPGAGATLARSRSRRGRGQTPPDMSAVWCRRGSGADAAPV
jgi:hypothetical protein